MLRRLILACVLGALSLVAPAHAAGDAKHPEHYPWSFEGPFGAFDQAAVQRGYHVYKSLCASCHSMNHLSYRHLGDPGGPFEARFVRNEETGALEQKLASVIGHKGRFVQPAENLWVRAIAASVDGVTGMDPSGQPELRTARPSDRFKAPFANEAQGAATYGVNPPDLSVIIKARHGGADYTRALLLGYQGDWRNGTPEQKDGKYVNVYFPGQVIAMTPPLTEAAVGRLEYADGTTPTIEQAAADVTHFLAWASDPHMQARKTLGVQVLAFLLVLSILLYLAYKSVWRNESH